MHTSDPMSAVFTKIRNASAARHPNVDVVASKLTEHVLGILKQEGFIRTFKPTGQAPRRQFRVYLKYGPEKTPVITHLVRVSRPGLRVYRGAEELPRALGGLGCTIVTTSQGVMTGQQARRQRLGGEVLGQVW